LLPSIIQAVGLIIISSGLGLIFVPAGITALGISFVLVGLSLERSK
jgi:hypothetical protein